MEVRPSTTGGKYRGLGCFAGKNYEVGDFILEDENVLFQLAPSSEHEESKLIELVSNSSSFKSASGNTGKAASTVVDKGDESTNHSHLFDVVTVPETVPSEYNGKFKGMVQAGLCFLKYFEDEQNKSQLQQLLELYYPSSESVSEEDKEIIGISRLAVEFVLNNAKSSLPSLSDQEKMKEIESLLFKVVLIWSCNSFEGGRIYKMISRINHSCNPNAMIHTKFVDGRPSKSQSVRALTAIRVGDEITISYLGLFLYAEYPIRQSVLRNTKHFACSCTRCRGELENPLNDTAAYIPCPLCHPRESGGRQLDEESQYDDDDIGSYVCGWSLEKGSSDQPSTPSSLSCRSCQDKKSSIEPQQWRKDVGILTNAMQQVRDKIVAFLHNKRKPKRKVLHVTNKEEEGEDDDGGHQAVQSMLLDELIRLASSVMGAKHWTTNLLLLFQLDDLLHSVHTGILLNGERPDMTILAEAIDYLQRLNRFVDAFPLLTNMDHKKGHLLSSVIIGSARALVSMSDIKSQRYAVQWVEPIRDYVRVFESPGLYKVLDTIADAHKHHNGKDSDEDNSNDENDNDDENVGGTKRDSPSKDEEKREAKKPKQG